MACDMCGQFLLDVTDVGYFFQVPVHALVGRDRQQESPFRVARSRLVFSRISRGISRRGMSHMLSVFSLALRIHQRPSSACTMCSAFRCFTSVKASPVKEQKMKMSRTVCRRSMSMSLAIMRRSSDSFRKSRLVLVCLKWMSANGSSLIHFSEWRSW